MTSIGYAYPPPDALVRDHLYLTVRTPRGLDQAARYAVFFRALFDTTLAELCPAVKSPQALRQRLKLESSERRLFYEALVNKAISLLYEEENGSKVRINLQHLHSRNLPSH